jgi:hypothetical protein
MTAYHLSGPVPIKRPVTLPADFPIVEKRAPLGLAVLTVLLVVGVGYAAWHYLPREQSVVAEKVPPVPDRLLASTPNPAPSTEAQPAATTASAPAPVTPPVQPTQEARPTPGNLPAEVWPARREAAAPPPPQPPQGAPLAPPVVSAVPPPPPPPVVMNLPGPGQAQAAQPPAAPSSRVCHAAASAGSAAATGRAPAVEEAARPPAADAPAFRFVPTRPSGARQQLDRAARAQRRRPGADLRAGRRELRRAGGIAYRIVDAR